MVRTSRWPAKATAATRSSSVTTPESAKTPESWQAFVDTFLSGSEEDYQAAVKKFADSSKAGEQAK